MLKRGYKRKAKRDISYLHKRKKFKGDINLRVYICTLHDNDQRVCGFYDCPGNLFNLEKKENKEYLI